MKFDSKNIAGVVVLYNPVDSTFQNIDSYLNFLDKLYVIDNSIELNLILIRKLKSINKINYLRQEKNIGIAAALNIAANKAVDDGYFFLLTMDQDSVATPGMFEGMINFINLNNVSRIAIISPQHNMDNYKIVKKNSKWNSVEFVPTSGNLLNLSIYSELKGFEEKLFIDYVDVEFCLRAKKNGFKVIQINSSVLDHKLGDLKKKKFLWRYVAVTNHAPIRVYYRIRNRIYIFKKYFISFPRFIISVCIRSFNELIKIILFEDNRKTKTRFFFLGIIHGITNKYNEI